MKIAKAIVFLRHCRRRLFASINWCGSQLNFEPEYVTDFPPTHINIYDKNWMSWFAWTVNYSNKWFLGIGLIKRCNLTNIDHAIVEIRRSYDCPISTMAFPMVVRLHLYIESRPEFLIPSSYLTAGSLLIVSVDRSQPIKRQAITRTNEDPIFLLTRIPVIHSPISHGQEHAMYTSLKHTTHIAPWFSRSHYFYLNRISL